MKMLGILRKICPFILPSSHLTLYYSLIFPHINYCNIVWAATYSSYLSKLLVTGIQKRFLRMTQIGLSHLLLSFLNILYYPLTKLTFSRPVYLCLNLKNANMMSLLLFMIFFVLLLIFTLILHGKQKTL